MTETDIATISQIVTCILHKSSPLPRLMYLPEALSNACPKHQSKL